MGWELFSVPRKKCGILSHIPRIEYPRYIGMYCFFLENRRWDQKHFVALHGDAFDNRLHGLHGLHAISDVWCTV